MGDDLQAVVYFSAREGQKIEKGMQASIDPSSSDREDYGFLLGEVSSVSMFPAVETEIARTLGSADLASEITSSGPVIEVRIDLIPDSSNSSGFTWSSRKGPEEKLHAGILCNGEVILARRNLIQLVLPDISEESRHANP
jgi:HlyD family secretion protein